MQPGACCTSNVGLDFDGGLQIGDSVTDVKVISRPNLRPNGKAAGGGFLQKVEDAIQFAVHPDFPPGQYAANIPGGGMMQPLVREGVAFPVVSPYRPLTATRVPVAGLTAFPKSGYYFNGEPEANFNVDGDDPNDTAPGYESLSGLDAIGIEPAGGGPSWVNQGYNVNMPSGFSLPTSSSYSSGSTKLQTIIGGIAAILPSTISAFKQQPYYNPNQAAGQQTASGQQQTAGSQQQPTYSESGQRAPEGYYYNDKGVLAKVGAGLGEGVGTIGQTITDFVTENPLVVLGLGAAALLMFMKPPGRR